MTVAGGRAAPSAGEVLAAARRSLRAHDLADELTLLGPAIVSGQADVYVLGCARGSPRYVAKVARPGSGASSASAQFAALQACHRWWAAEDRHGVAAPVAMLPDAAGFLMQYVPGPNLSGVLSRVLTQPAAATAAAMAAGDFLRRFHRHARTADVEFELSTLVGEIRASEAADLHGSGLVLPEAVQRTLDRAPATRLVTRRVLLHGDYTPRNLILSPHGQVVMIDPILEGEGLAEDDVAAFLTMMSSASMFAGGLAFPFVRQARQRLQRAFLAGYGADNASPVILGLRLIYAQMWRWAYRRRRDLRRGERRYAALRARLIDAQMSALLEESAAALDKALAEAKLTRPSRGPVALSRAARAGLPP